MPYANINGRDVASTTGLTAGKGKTSSAARSTPAPKQSDSCSAALSILTIGYAELVLGEIPWQFF